MAQTTSSAKPTCIIRSEISRLTGLESLSEFMF